MDKKNYLSKAEQKLWEYIQEKEIVDGELVSQIFPNMPAGIKNKLLHSLYSKKYLRRAERNVYYNPRRLTNFHQLGLRIHEGYLGLSSALRYYNLLEYEDFTLFIFTQNFRKKIALSGTQREIIFIPLQELYQGYQRKEGIVVSTLEKTFFDCFLKPQLIGYSTLTKALHDAEDIDWRAFLSFFSKTRNMALRQRTGYILEMLKTEINMKIPEFVFTFLKKGIQKPAKLSPIKGKSFFNRKWKLQDNVGMKNILAWWY